MTDRATIPYPYRTREGKLRKGRWTGSRAAAFNAGSEALGGLTAHSLPEDGKGRWAYTDAVTKTRYAVSTEAVITLGAALIRCLPEERERTWRDKDLADIAQDGGKLGALAATEAPKRHRPSFDDLLSAWLDSTDASPADADEEDHHPPVQPRPLHQIPEVRALIDAMSNTRLTDRDKDPT